MRSVFLCLLFVITAAEPGHAEAPLTAAALAPDGKQAVLGSQNGIELRSWPGLAVLRALPTDLAHVHDLQFAPDGQTLLAAGGSPAEEGAVELLSWPKGERVRRVAGHDDVVYRVAWSPDGKQWATAGADGICQIFGAPGGEPRIRYEGHSRAVLSLCFLPDGKTIASVGVDQTVRLWDSASGAHLRTLDNHVGTVNGVAARPSASTESPATVATISEDRTVRLWQPTIGRLMRFARLPSAPRSLAWSTSGDRLFVGCNDGRLRVLDVDSLDSVLEQDAQVGRIHELVRDPARDLILVVGERGCRAIVIDKPPKN